MLLSKLPRIPSQVPLARYLSSTTPLLARLRPATRLSPETGATLSPSPPPSSSPPPLPPQQPSAELFDRPPPRALTYEEEELRARKNESRKQRVKEESSIRAELGISRRGRKLKGPVLERSLRDRAGILGVKTAPLPDWKIKQLEKRAAREAAAAGSSGGFLIPDGVSPDTRPSISSEQTRAPKKQWTPPPPKETSWADDEDPNSPVFRPAWANERLTEDVRSSRSYQEQQSTRRSDDEDEPSPLYSPGRSFFDPSPPPTSHASHTHKLASSSPSASTSEPPLSPFEPPTAAPKKRLIPAFTDDSGSFIPPSKPWEKPSITPHLPNRPFVASEPPIHPSWTGTQLPLDPSGQPISVSAYEAALLRKKKVPLQQAAIAGRGLPDRWERCAKIHPMFKQQRGRVEGAFFETRREALEALAERKKLGDTAWKRTLKEKEETRRKEKLKGEVKTKEVDPEAPKPKLSLHINSLSASLTADQLYHDLLSAEFPLLTLELIPNDPLQTAIVELGSDENLIASLKALGEKDTYKGRIEITGDASTESQYFRPSKTRLLLSSVPPYTTLGVLAHMLEAHSLNPLALQLIKYRSTSISPSPPSVFKEQARRKDDDPSNPFLDRQFSAQPLHSGAAYAWFSEEDARKALSLEIVCDGGATLQVAVAKEEPMPRRSNKPDRVNGPGVLVKWRG